MAGGKISPGGLALRPVAEADHATTLTVAAWPSIWLNGHSRVGRRNEPPCTMSLRPTISPSTLVALVLAAITAAAVTYSFLDGDDAQEAMTATGAPAVADRASDLLIEGADGDELAMRGTIRLTVDEPVAGATASTRPGRFWKAAASALTGPHSRSDGIDDPVLGHLVCRSNSVRNRLRR